MANLFDSSSHTEATIRRADGEKRILLRPPTDEEWIARQRRVIIHVIRRGRGITENDIDSMTADAALYNAIKSEDSPDLAPEEAAAVITQMMRCEVNDVKLELDQAWVTMTTAGGSHVAHCLKLPTTLDVTKWRRGMARFIDMPHGRQQVRTNIQPTLELYEKCYIAADGYVNGVPALHKDTAMQAVVNACESGAEALKEEDF
jgi:hypothetical protein